MRKTEAKRGKAAAFKLRDDEEEMILMWINAQSVYGDSMRYLIQKEIAENGIRNIQEFVPRSRDIESVRRQLIQEKMIQSELKPIETLSDDIVEIGKYSENNASQEKLTLSNDISSPTNDTKEVSEYVATSNTNNVKRPAGKTFDPEVISSYQN